MVEHRCCSLPYYYQIKYHVNLLGGGGGGEGRTARHYTRNSIKVVGQGPSTSRAVGLARAGPYAFHQAARTSTGEGGEESLWAE